MHDFAIISLKILNHGKRFLANIGLRKPVKMRIYNEAPAKSSGAPPEILKRSMQLTLSEISNFPIGISGGGIFVISHSHMCKVIRNFYR